MLCPSLYYSLGVLQDHSRIFNYTIGVIPFRWVMALFIFNLATADCQLQLCPNLTSTMMAEVA